MIGPGLLSLSASCRRSNTRHANQLSDITFVSSCLTLFASFRSPIAGSTGLINPNQRDLGTLGDRVRRRRDGASLLSLFYFLISSWSGTNNGEGLSEDNERNDVVTVV